MKGEVKMESKQEPIRTFNVKDSEDKVYEIKVFEAIIQIQLDGYNIKPYRDEIMCIDNSIVLPDGNKYFVDIDGKQIDLYNIT